LPFFIFSFSNKTGVSKPAESNRANILLGIFLSGNLILKPCVFRLVPKGKYHPDILERIKDLPLFEFPITPTLITLFFINSPYF